MNRAEARIGDDAIVTSDTGDISVVATVSDKPQMLAYSDVESDPLAKNTRENAVSAAISVGLFVNDADASIGNSAIVTATQGDVAVLSETRVPWEQRWWKWTGLDSITDKLNFNLGIQNGLFTSWAEAYASGKKNAFGGSVNIMTFESHSDAFIDPNAQVTAAGDASVIALNENDTVNFAGQFLFALPNATFGLAGATSGGSGVGGAVVLVAYENDVNARIKSDVVLDAASLLVMSRTDERNITLTTQGGQADKFAFNGAASVLLVDNTTRAQIDDEAKITLGAGFVAVPRDYDTVPIDSVSLFSDLPQFNPSEAFTTDDNDNDILRVDDASDVIALPYDHGLATGDGVRYTNGGGANIGGLTNGGFYFAIMINESRVQLAYTRTEALAGQSIEIDLDSTEGFAHTLYPAFNPTVAITADGESEIDLGYEHGLQSGQEVVYFNGSVSNQNISGLVDGDSYRVDVVNDTTLTLSALPSGDVVVLNPSQSTGGDHYLIPQEGEVTVDNTLNSLDSDGDGDVDTDDEHIAVVTDNFYVTDLSLLVLADDNAGLYSGTGGFTLGRNIGVGVSVSVSDIRRDTQALIGNLSTSLGLPGSSFGPGVGVDSQDEIYLGYNHGLSQGDLVTYSSGGDYVIEGLDDGGVYFVNLVGDSDSSDDPTIKLARTLLEAQEDGSTSFAVDDVADGLGSDSIDLGYVHGFQLGDAVSYNPGADGTAIGGLDATDGIYYVIPTGSQSVALATTLGGALDNFDLVFDPLDTVDSNQLIFAGDHTFSDGQVVRYTSGGGTSIGGLTDGDLYVINLVDELTLELQDFSGNTITLDASASAGIRHTLKRAFVPDATNVDSANDVINLGYFSGLNNGQAVQYSAPGGNAINGLTDGDVYYAIVDGEEAIALANSAAEADLAKWRFFDPVNAITDSTIDLDVLHEYQTGTELIYTTTEFFGDSSSANTTALKYIDPDNGTQVTLQEGDLLYAIPVDSGFTVTELDGTTHPYSTAIQLALSADDAIAGNALTLVNTDTDDGAHGFRTNSGRIEISANSTEDPGHLLTPLNRIDLDASAGTGSNQTLRLSLDPSTALKNTHGLGRVIDPSTAVANNTITLANHGFKTGDAVVYGNGRGTSIGGIGHGNIYYVVRTGANTFQLTDNQKETLADTPEVIELTGADASGASHGFGRVIRPEALVDSQLDTIDFGVSHRFQDGDFVIYDSGAGTEIGGLTSESRYQVVVINKTTIQLADETTGTVLSLDGTLATGSDHTLSEPVGSGFVTSAGDAMIVSNNGGEIISVSLAASIATPAKSGAVASGAMESSDSGDSVSNAKPKNGISIAGDVTVNIISDTTKAFIRDTDFSATDLDLIAQNGSLIASGSGAVAISTSTEDSKGIAGSFSVNVIDNDTQAFIDNSQVVITGGNLDISADSSAEIFAVGLSGAGVSGSFALAGSVVFNVISNTTQAVVSNFSDLTVTEDAGGVAGETGNVSLHARDTNEIVAIAGAGAVASGFSTNTQTGIGAAIVVNVIANSEGTRAEITDSDVTADGSESWVRRPPDCRQRRCRRGGGRRNFRYGQGDCDTDQRRREHRQHDDPSIPRAQEGDRHRRQTGRVDLRG